MHCEQAETLLAQLIFGELDAEQKTQLEAHLAECAACAEALSDMRRAAGLLKEGLESGQPPVLSAERKAALLKAVSVGHGMKVASHAKLKPPRKLFGLEPKFVFRIAAGLLIVALLAGMLLPWKVRYSRSTRPLAGDAAPSEGYDVDFHGGSVSAKAGEWGGSSQSAGDKVESAPAEAPAAPAPPALPSLPDQTVVVNNGAAQTVYKLGVAMGDAKKPAPSASPAADAPPPLQIAKLAPSEESKPGETARIYGAFIAGNAPAIREKAVDKVFSLPEADIDLFSQQDTSVRAHMYLPIPTHQDLRVFGEQSAEKAPALNGTESIAVGGGVVTKGLEAKVGPPAPPKPSQRASAEGAPPLPLPATPARRTEKKPAVVAGTGKVDTKSAPSDSLLKWSQTKEAQVPYSEVLIYPDNWKEIIKRKAEAVGSEAGDKSAPGNADGDVAGVQVINGRPAQPGTDRRDEFGIPVANTPGYKDANGPTRGTPVEGGGAGGGKATVVNGPAPSQAKDMKGGRVAVGQPAEAKEHAAADGAELLRAADKDKRRKFNELAAQVAEMTKKDRDIPAAELESVIVKDTTTDPNAGKWGVVVARSAKLGADADLRGNAVAKEAEKSGPEGKSAKAYFRAIPETPDVAQKADVAKQAGQPVAPKPVEEKKSGGIAKALSSLIPHGTVKASQYRSLKNESTENPKAATQVESGMGVMLPSEKPGSGDTFGYFETLAPSKPIDGVVAGVMHAEDVPTVHRRYVDTNKDFLERAGVNKDYLERVGINLDGSGNPVVKGVKLAPEKPAFIKLPAGSDQADGNTASVGAKDAQLKLYDVSDVNMEIRDFPGNLSALRDRVGGTEAAAAQQKPDGKPASPDYKQAREQVRQAKEALSRNPNDQAAKEKLATGKAAIVSESEKLLKGLNTSLKQATDDLNRGDLDKAAQHIAGQPQVLAKLPACNELVQKMREVYEISSAPSAGDKAAADKRNEKILEGFKDIRSRIGDMEAWLGNAPDAVKWKVENYDKSEIPQIPLVDLPEELEDLVGDLLDQDEEGKQATDTTATAEEQPEDLSQLPVFKAFPPNPFVMTEKDRLSTFGLDVDTASYTLARRFIRSGKLPPAASVRPEEFINAFDYNYPKQSGQAFAVYAEGMPSPFRPGLVLLKVGVQGKVLGREGRKPAHLVFVIDSSGSMAKADRMPLVQEALAALAGQLGKDDRVSIVTYGTDARLVLEAVPASEKRRIVRTILSVQCGGSTNLLQGVQLGYAIAQRAFRTGGINRVILCSDGVANVGLTDSEEMLGQVAGFKEQGISFMSIGFGMGSYNDDLMQKLADKGDGSYVFVDTPQEARRVVNEQIAATLQTIGKDAKIQVEFNPQAVRRYRLIGYEKREIADKDFRNDAIDAGEVGSGQSSTALYELELLADEGGRVAGDIGTVFVRYRNTETDKVEEISTRMENSIIAARAASESPRLHLAAAVAQFAEILRESEYAPGGNFDGVRRILEQVAIHLPLDQRVADVLDLVQTADGMPKAQ